VKLVPLAVQGSNEVTYWILTVPWRVQLRLRECRVRDLRAPQTTLCLKPIKDYELLRQSRSPSVTMQVAFDVLDLACLTVDAYGTFT